MTDRYDEGYERAEQFYKSRFNMRNGLLTDTAKAWQQEGHDKARYAIRKTWPDLASQLDQIVVEAKSMTETKR